MNELEYECERMTKQTFTRDGRPTAGLKKLVPIDVELEITEDDVLNILKDATPFTRLCAIWKIMDSFPENELREAFRALPMASMALLDKLQTFGLVMDGIRKEVKAIVDKELDKSLRLPTNP